MRKKAAIDSDMKAERMRNLKKKGVMLERVGGLRNAVVGDFLTFKRPVKGIRAVEKSFRKAIHAQELYRHTNELEKADEIMEDVNDNELDVNQFVTKVFLISLDLGKMQRLV